MADIRTRFGARLKLAAAALTALVLSGCASTFPPTGMVLKQYAAEHVVPYSLGTTDVNLAVCGTGLGQAHLIGSFQRVVSDPDYLMFNLGQLSAYCAEADAHEANLRYLRARADGQVEEATDASIAEKNGHALTAARRYQAYRHMVAQYEDPASGECPFFWWDEDELAYMLGLVTGMQAVRSDMLSGAQVGVPRNLAVNAMNGSRCLDNQKWWGVPQAIRATAWAYVPGTKPDDEDIWENFRQAAEVASSSGVRLVHALYATSADNRGATEELKNAIGLAAELQRETPALEDYALVDAIAGEIVKYFSDKVWTQEAGHRTPVGQFGEFPGDDSAPEVDVEGLL